jgi:hypothetical protein
VGPTHLSFSGFISKQPKNKEMQGSKLVVKPVIVGLRFAGARMNMECARRARKEENGIRKKAGCSCCRDRYAAHSTTIFGTTAVFAVGHATRKTNVADLIIHTFS